MIHMIDMCAGIGTFTYANSQITNSPFNFLGSCEIDPYCNRLLEQQGHELLGPIDILGLPESQNPISQACYEQDMPLVEITGITTITHEDIMTGAVEWPNGLCIGFPCQNISPSATEDLSGINGGKSNVIYDALAFADNYQLDYVIAENSSQLPNRGLDTILLLLDEMGYAAEWEIISCAHYGYPHYRHRTFIIAYRENTAPFLLNEQVFARVREFAKYQPGDKFPLLQQHDESHISLAQTLETRGNYRRDRVGALGNSVHYDVAYSIMSSLADIINESKTVTTRGLNFDRPNHRFDIDTLPVNKAGFREMPKRGFMYQSQFYTDVTDDVLNPKSTQYKGQGMLPTLLRADMKNNFTSTSRTSRPGGLGGLVGSLQTHFGFCEGGLNPNYCEGYLGFPQNFTQITEQSSSSFKLPY